MVQLHHLYISLIIRYTYYFYTYYMNYIILSVDIIIFIFTTGPREIRPMVILYMYYTIMIISVTRFGMFLTYMRFIYCCIIHK